jgi:hypothetical protein
MPTIHYNYKTGNCDPRLESALNPRHSQSLSLKQNSEIYKTTDKTIHKRRGEQTNKTLDQIRLFKENNIQGFV